MPAKPVRLPEIAIRNNNCFNENFMFHKEATEIAEKINEILDSFDDNGQLGVDDRPIYINNVIGVLGQRGTGKTTLVSSIAATLVENPRSAPYLNSAQFNIFPLVNNIVDPKVLPDYVGIIDLTISALFNDFKSSVKNGQSSKVSDETIERLYVLFEDVSRSVQLLSCSERSEAIGDQSDLYDISSLIQIRSKLEELVQELLRLKTGGNHPRSAFIITIDDFDLDFSNCYRMALQIVSMLNIKGLIFFLAMDETLFREEVVRARVRSQSDYGNASSYILDSSIRYRGDFGVNQIWEREKQYFEQLYSKLIPADFRFKVKGHLLLESGSDDFKKLFTGFCEWIFGIMPYWANRKSPDKNSFVDRFYTLFLEAVSFREDLRVRNQGINRILSIMESKNENIKSERELIDELVDVINIFAFSGTPTIKAFWQRVLEDLRMYSWPDDSKIRYFAENSSKAVLTLCNEESFNVYEKGKDFFDKHPASFAAYEMMVSYLSPKPGYVLVLLEDYKDIITAFGFSAEIVERKNANGGVDDILVFDSPNEIDTDHLANSLFYNNREMLIKRMTDLQRAGEKVAKQDIRSAVTDLNAYLVNRATIKRELQPFINEINEALAEKWKGKEANKEESISRIASALLRIKRRL